MIEMDEGDCTAGNPKYFEEEQVMIEEKELMEERDINWALHRTYSDGSQEIFSKKKNKVIATRDHLGGWDVDL